jgi:hypothetical protein
MPSGYSEFRSAGSTPPPSQLDAGDGDDKSDDDGPTMDRPRRLNRRSLSGWGDGLDRHLTRTLSRAAALTRTQVRSAREHYQSRNRGMVGFGWGLRSAGSAEVSRGQLEVSRFSRRSAGSAGSAEGQPDQMLHSKEQQGGGRGVRRARHADAGRTDGGDVVAADGETSTYPRRRWRCSCRAAGLAHGRRLTVLVRPREVTGGWKFEVRFGGCVTKRTIVCHGRKRSGVQLISGTLRKQRPPHR